MTREPALMIFVQDYRSITRTLSSAQKGELLDALMLYADSREEYSGGDPVLRAVFWIFADKIARNQEAYRLRCEKNRKNVSARYRKDEAEAETESAEEADDPEGEDAPEDPEDSAAEPGDTEAYESVPSKTTKTKSKTQTRSKDVDSSPRKRPPFRPPDPEEVEQYCRERNNGIDGRHFCDYYTARGWELSRGRKMKDWRAAVRTWESNRKGVYHGSQVHSHEDRGNPEQRAEYWL